ncbi:hypothetical protein X801_08043, partial [Opisthorchis viverrini]
MSEATEQEQVVPRPRPDAVPLSVLIEFICQKIYTDLMRLVDFISLQLDVLHEQAQRARAKRPADQLVIEAYRPGHSMVLSYWHTLSRNQFQAQLCLDGKLQPTAYLLSIHADPVDPQRPLCVSHRPELPETQSHRIGTILQYRLSSPSLVLDSYPSTVKDLLVKVHLWPLAQGNHLSIEKLLARTIITRAEHILQ